MTVKSLEQRIIERAQNELRERISYMVAGLRNQLEGDEGRIAVKLEASDGLFPIDELLNVVESELFRATRVRHCNSALEITLASLEADLAYRNQVCQPQTQPPFGVPPAPNGRQGN